MAMCESWWKESASSLSQVGLDASLRVVPMLKDLSDEQRASLISAMEDLSFEQGEYIIETGQEADALYFIVSGEVVCTRNVEFPHQSKELVRLGQGQVDAESLSPPPSALRFILTHSLTRSLESLYSPCGTSMC